MVTLGQLKTLGDSVYTTSSESDKQSLISKADKYISDGDQHKYQQYNPEYDSFCHKQ